MNKLHLVLVIASFSVGGVGATCQQLKQDAKSGLTDVQVACAIEKAFLGNAEAAAFCNVADDLIPAFTVLLNETRVSNKRAVAAALAEAGAPQDASAPKVALKDASKE